MIIDLVYEILKRAGVTDRYRIVYSTNHLDGGRTILRINRDFAAGAQITVTWNDSNLIVASHLAPNFINYLDPADPNFDKKLLTFFP